MPMSEIPLRTRNTAGSQVDGHSASIGSTTDSAASSDTGTFSLIALVKRLLSKLTTQLPAALGANGGLKIEGVASGTAVPAAQSGTWTVQPGNTANTTAWKVDGSAVTQPVSGTVAVSSAPVAARTTDTISAAMATDAIMSSTTVLTPKFANIAVASSGDNTLVSAVSSKKIRVLEMALVASAATNIYLHDGAGTPIALFGNSTNKVQLAANGGFILPFSPVGWFETSTTNVTLVLNLSAANAVAGALTYVEV